MALSCPTKFRHGEADSRSPGQEIPAPFGARYWALY
jgi:hypothetical protein